MTPSKRSIQNSIRALRRIIDDNANLKDPITTRMAYFGEICLRWSIEDTKGWKRPEGELIDEVYLLKQEMELKG